MDWFMLTAMVIAGWAVLSTFAGEHLARQRRAATSPAAEVPSSPANLR